MSSHVLYVAPFFSTNILQCLDALIGLNDVRVGLITHEPIDRVPERYRPAIAGHYQVSDCLDADQLSAAALAFKRDWGRVDRLIGFLEQMQLPLAVARDRVGIAGMGEQVARNFREKNQMKEVLRAAGLPVAGQRLIHGPDEARAMVADFGYPLVIKPPAGLGSRGTMRVTDDEELAAALAALMVSPSNPAQAEEFIRGEEHTFETVTIRGKPRNSRDDTFRPRCNVLVHMLQNRDGLPSRIDLHQAKPIPARIAHRAAMRIRRRVPSPAGFPDFVAGATRTRGVGRVLGHAA